MCGVFHVIFCFLIRVFGNFLKFVQIPCTGSEYLCARNDTRVLRKSKTTTKYDIFTMAKKTNSPYSTSFTGATFMFAEFTFDFHAKHDRSIQVDNDWYIVPGRGLDIFEKIDTKFSMRKIRDQYKPCREFSITYNPCPEELKD